MAGTDKKIMDAHPNLKRDLSFYPVDNPSPKLLTLKEIDQFNEKGYITGLPLFSADEIAEHRAYFDRILEGEITKGKGGYSINGWHHTHSAIYDLVKTPKISDYVADLLGENLICWGTHYFSKMPGDGKAVSWHQDASYWPLTPSKTVTVWLAIDDTDVENGAMRFIPGSHRLGQIGFRKSRQEDRNVLGQTVDDTGEFGDSAVDIELKAGEISLHSDLLLHSSNPNSSKRRRCGLTMRFIPPDVRAFDNWNGRSIVTRGSDPDNHWENVARLEEE